MTLFFSLFTLSSIQPIKMRNTERHRHIIPLCMWGIHPLFVEKILVLQQENDSETIDGLQLYIHHLDTPTVIIRTKFG